MQLKVCPLQPGSLLRRSSLERQRRGADGAATFRRAPLAHSTPWIPRFRSSNWDAALVALALGQGLLLVGYPSVWLIALGILWNSNTVAHYFIHAPFFEQPSWNRCFCLYQSLLLGIPQRLWRDRHLAHHAGMRARFRWSWQLVVEGALVLTLWSCLVTFAPEFFFAVYAPGYILGLLLCFVHGHYEHANGTTSHYGWLYNRLFFNDGYHLEHHQAPRLHWRSLPAHRARSARASAWPATLRWLELINLQLLERGVLRSKLLQHFVSKRHERAFQSLLDVTERSGIERIGIVGGALFPRTALILRRLVPQARIQVIDENEANIEIARRWTGDEVEYVAAHYACGSPDQFDLVVIPLAFHGDRTALCRRPPARLLFMHDWIWRPRGRSRIVSWCLLKRLNRLDA
jgi:hypothetical protein